MPPALEYAILFLGKKIAFQQECIWSRFVLVGKYEAAPFYLYFFDSCHILAFEMEVRTMERYKKLIVNLIERADNLEKLKIIYRFVKKYLD